MPDFAIARRNMIEGQLRTNGVTDPALVAALFDVPREVFVDHHLRGVAYIDEDLPLGKGRVLVEPLVFARMVQAARVAPGDLVLDVGCATGYTSAVLARIASMVVALESDPELAERTRSNLAAVGIENVVVIEGRLNEGHAPQAPYDVITIDGAVPGFGSALRNQLAEGGRMTGVVVVPDEGGKMRLEEKHKGIAAGRMISDAMTARLPDFQAEPGFVF